MLFRSKPTAALLPLLSTVSLMAGAAGAQSLSTRELNARSAAQSATAVPLTPLPGGGYVTPVAPDPVEALSRYLRVLATSPRNLDALTGAGNAALAIGDANAAVSLFARAEEVSPRNGRIKAGLASGLVQLDQPRTAIKLFDDAVSLGVPEAEIAGDRGLAHDLRGDTKRAQADYAQALRWRADDEITRRLAVSQAISGDKAAALATLDGLLRRQDRAAWRIRAFVLALTGDRAGAEAAAIAVMPQAQAQALIPFFGRLAALQPGQKAAAVHLGQFPADGYAGTSSPSRFANSAPPPVPTRSGSSPSASQLVPAGPAFGTMPAAGAGAYPSGASGMAAGQGGTGRFVPPPTMPSPPTMAPPQVGGTAPTTPAASAPAPLPPSASPPASAYYPPAPAIAPAPVAPPLANGAVARPFASSASVSGAVPVPAAAGQSATTPLPVSSPVTNFPAQPPGFVPQPEVQLTQATASPGTAGGASDSLADGVAVVGATAGVAPAPSPPAPAAGAPASVGQGAATIRPFDVPASMPARTEPPASSTVSRPLRPAPSAEGKAEADRAKAGAAKPSRDNGETDKPRKASDVKVDKVGKSKDAETTAAGTKGKKSQDPKDAKGKSRTDPKGAKGGTAGKDAKDSKSATRDAKAGGKSADKAEKAEKDAKPASSGGEKYWVQVASGSNRTDLGKEWAKTRAKAPKLLGGRATWTTPWKQSNRLLVGPFKSEEEAQGLVNSLGKAGFGGIPFTTRGNAKVERLGSE